MNDALAGMIPYDSIGLYEQPKPRFFFKMPRVVPEQKSKFESDELFRRLSRECEVSNCQHFFRFFSSRKWSQNYDFYYNSMRLFIWHIKKFIHKNSRFVFVFLLTHNTNKIDDGKFSMRMNHKFHQKSTIKFEFAWME